MRLIRTAARMREIRDDAEDARQSALDAAFRQGLQSDEALTVGQDAYDEKYDELMEELEQQERDAEDSEEEETA